MYLTRKMIESLANDPEQFEIVNRTDHAEWFGGMKASRVFSPTDIYSDQPGMVFESTKGLFMASPEGKMLKVDLSCPIGLKGKALSVVLNGKNFEVSQ